MKKTLLVTAMAATMAVATSADAAFTALADGDYIMTINSGCFAFGNCLTLADGVSPITDNTTDAQAGFAGFGSGIANDGVAGIINFTVTGGSFDVTSYAQDSYLNTTGGTFYLQDQDDLGLLMSGTIDNVTDGGAMTFDPTGRDGIAGKFAGSLGLQEWNRDNTSDGLGSGVYDIFTTGSSSNRTQGFTGGFTITGSALVDDGSGGWTGTLVSAGNIGENWGDFNNTQYSEVWDVQINAVPVPAAVWLFGSGLIGLVGVARRRKSS